MSVARTRFSNFLASSMCCKSNHTRESERETKRQTDGRTDGRTDRQTDKEQTRQTDERQTARQRTDETGRQNRQMKDRQECHAFLINCCMPDIPNNLNTNQSLRARNHLPRGISICCNSIKRDLMTTSSHKNYYTISPCSPQLDLKT